MDDAEYREKAKRKLVNYTRAGIIPGVNLIITYETDYNPLDFQVVKKLIDAYFGWFQNVLDNIEVTGVSIEKIEELASVNA